MNALITLAGGGYAVEVAPADGPHRLVPVTLGLAGATDAEAKKQARTVMEIEMALAKASMDKVDRRDPNKIYHRLERAGLKKVAPHFLWDAYFDELGAPSVQAINVLTPDFFAGMDKLLSAKGKLNDLKTYLRWTAI